MGPSFFKLPACVGLLLAMSCAHNAGNKTNHKLVGVWHSGTDKTLLKITDKTFTMESDSPEPEDYFLKGDTIFTSYQGNLPYTKYVIKKLDNSQLSLFTPDSTTVEFTR